MRNGHCMDRVRASEKPGTLSPCVCRYHRMGPTREPVCFPFQAPAWFSALEDRVVEQRDPADPRGCGKCVGQGLPRFKESLSMGGSKGTVISRLSGEAAVTWHVMMGEPFPH